MRRQPGDLADSEPAYPAPTLELPHSCEPGYPTARNFLGLLQGKSAHTGYPAVHVFHFFSRYGVTSTSEPTLERSGFFSGYRVAPVIQVTRYLEPSMESDMGICVKWYIQVSVNLPCSRQDTKKRVHHPETIKRSFVESGRSYPVATLQQKNTNNSLEHILYIICICSLQLCPLISPRKAI